MRFLFVFLFFTSSQLLAQLPVLPQNARQWMDKNGNPIETGVLNEIEKRNIFVTPPGKARVKLKIQDLSKDDQGYVESLHIYQQEKVQYDLVSGCLVKFRKNPKNSLVFLKNIEDSHDETPYVLAMIGIAYAKGDANYLEAKKYFKKAEKLIKSGQKILGPEFHERTRASIRNNIAVCDFKTKAANKGATFLEAEAKKLDSIPLHTSHNAKLAMTKDKVLCYGILLSRSAVKKLGAILKMPQENNVGLAQEKFFVYSLDWDAPYTLDQILQANQGNPLPPNPDPNFTARQLYEDDWCPICHGCQRMHCNRCGGRRLIPAPPIWGVRGVNPTTGQRHMGWIDQGDVKCQNCRGTGRVKCNCCTNGKIR